MRFDVIVIGHIAIDVNVLPWGIIENALGGAPTYAGLALAMLKKKVGIVSKVGFDFTEKFPPVYSKFGIDTEGIFVLGDQTTTFRNVYDEAGDRSQVCENVAAKISATDIPEGYKDSRAFYVSPIADEISADVLREVKREDNIVMLDPQGLFRKIGEGGKVEVVPRGDLGDFLKYVDVVKIGKDELSALKGPPMEALKELAEMGPKIVILTQGAKDTLVFSGGSIANVKVMKVDVKDPTGAGDVFGAAFLSRYLDTQDSVDSARFASVAASLKIRYKGPTGFPSEEEILDALRRG